MMVKATLISSLNVALANASAKNKRPGVSEQEALNNMAVAIADCVDAYIRTASIATPAGPGVIE